MNLKSPELPSRSMSRVTNWLKRNNKDIGPNTTINWKSLANVICSTSSGMIKEWNLGEISWQEVGPHVTIEIYR